LGGFSALQPDDIPPRGHPYPPRGDAMCIYVGQSLLNHLYKKNNAP